MCVLERFSKIQSHITTYYIAMALLASTHHYIRLDMAATVSIGHLSTSTGLTRQLAFSGSRDLT